MQKSSLGRKGTEEEMMSSLYVYQEELLCQNEELVEANNRLMALEKQSQQLLNDAPEAMVIMDSNQVVLTYNVLAKKYFIKGAPFQKVQTFIDPSYQDDFHFMMRDIGNGPVGKCMNFVRQGEVVAGKMSVAKTVYSGRTAYYVIMTELEESL